MHYYLWARLVRDPHLPQTWARIATALIVALGVALPLSLVASRIVPQLSRPAAWVAFVWMGVGFLLVAFFGLADAGRLAASLVHRLRGSEPADGERRVFLARTLAAGVGAVVAGLSAIGVRNALGAVQVKELDIFLRGLPAELSGFRLVQISDLHVGALLRRDWVGHVVDRIGTLAPDLVAITGDLVDGSVAELRNQVAPLARLKAPRGVFFTTGNHEYYSGVEDWYAHLLMAHQPCQFAEAARHGVSLTLSGHTHGGQIWPFSWLVALAQPYLAGLHKRGESQLYVSRGTGFWGPPMRVFAPAEITLLKLHPA